MAWLLPSLLHAPFLSFCSFPLPWPQACHCHPRAQFEPSGGPNNSPMVDSLGWAPADGVLELSVLSLLTNSRCGRASPRGRPVSKHHVFANRCPTMPCIWLHTEGTENRGFDQNTAHGEPAGAPLPSLPSWTSLPSSCLRIFKQHCSGNRGFCQGWHWTQRSLKLGGSESQ